MNKMKDLSIIARVARMLTGARRVAVVLFTVLLTMTAQTAWAALDYDFNVDNVLYKVTSESPNKEVIIIGYEDGVAADLVIPATVSGYSVTEIEIEAFSDCTSLMTITIPKSVTSIGRSTSGSTTLIFPAVARLMIE